MGRVGGGHWQCRSAETDKDLEESSAAEREVVGGLQSCSSCLNKTNGRNKRDRKSGVGVVGGV